MTKTKKTILSILLGIVAVACCVIGLTAFGDEKVSQPSKMVYADGQSETPDYFYIENTGTSSGTIRLLKNGNPTKLPKKIEYKVGNNEWEELEIGTTSISLSKNSIVYFKGEYDNTVGKGNHTFGTNSYNNDYIKFALSNGSFTVGGDLTTLLNGEGNVKDLSPYGNGVFYGLFKSASNLTEFADSFKMPSTTLTEYCYAYMFSNATFTAVPEGLLPATNLAKYCYSYMFERCFSLKNAPDLPAKNLVDYCYSSMFYMSDKLESLRVNFSTWNDLATSTWFSSSATTFTFVCPEGLNVSTAKGSRIPQIIKNLGDNFKLYRLTETIDITELPASGLKGKYNVVESYYYDEVKQENVTVNSFLQNDVEMTLNDFMTYMKGNYLKTSLQLKDGDDDALIIRFISLLDANVKGYEEAGFVVKIVGGASYNLTTEKAYKSFIADGEEIKVEDVADENDHFFLCTMTASVPSDAILKVTPFVKLLTGETIYGTEVEINLGALNFD